MLPRAVARERAGLYANASDRQGLCVELQEEKQALQADIGRLNSSVADLKECVQTLRERESLNPLPTMPQRRKTVHTVDDRHVLVYKCDQSINNWFTVLPVELFVPWFAVAGH